MERDLECEERQEGVDHATAKQASVSRALEPRPPFQTGRALLDRVSLTPYSSVNVCHRDYLPETYTAETLGGGERRGERARAD